VEFDIDAIKQLLDARLVPIDQKLGSINDRLARQNGRLDKGEDERKELAVDLGKVQATCIARGVSGLREQDRLDRAVETTTSRLWSFISDNWQGASTLGVIIYLLANK